MNNVSATKGTTLLNLLQGLIHGALLFDNLGCSRLFPTGPSAEVVQRP